MRMVVAMPVANMPIAEPEPLEQQLATLTSQVVGHVGHADDGHGDSDGAEDVEGAAVATPGARPRGRTAGCGVTANRPDEELDMGIAEVAKASVEAERQALLALGKE